PRSLTVPTPDQRILQQQIRQALGVADTFDAQAEIEQRVAFLVAQMRASGMRGLVLGISGGVDSLTAGCLSQRAVERLRAEGGEARFTAMRLPYGTQLDESDAQASLAVI